MNNFSFQRIKLLLKADYTEYKIYLYYALGAFAAIISVAFIIMNMEDTERGKLQIQYSLFWLMLFSCSTYFCQYVGRKVHEYKNTYLTLPARTSEKYVVILLEGFLLLLLLYLLFTGCIVVRAKLSDYRKQPADREVIPFCRHVSDRPHVPGLSLVL